MLYFGNKDKGVSNVYKCWIQQGDIQVCGIIGEGSSTELTSQWESPFENMTAGSKFETVGAIAQEKTGLTSKSTMTSVQTWAGNQPFSINVSFELYALQNAKEEVSKATQSLQEFASPELNKNVPGGRRPQPVTINVGRKTIITEVFIGSVSAPIDGERTTDGDLITSTIQLQLQSKAALNRSDFNNIYK